MKDGQSSSKEENNKTNLKGQKGIEKVLDRSNSKDKSKEFELDEADKLSDIKVVYILYLYNDVNVD